jgi:hypothetical protein
MPMPENDAERDALQAAAFRRLLTHLEERSDVQNIDLMNLAGFCRNCLGKWVKAAADVQGVPLSADEARDAVYGMPYAEWKERHQRPATAAQQAAFASGSAGRAGDSAG